MTDDYTPQVWHLRPHRSLSPAGRRAVIGGTAAVSVVMAGVFAANGLWPMIAFTAIPPLGLAFGIAASNRSGKEWEEVRLDSQKLTITRHFPGNRPPAVTAIPPGWLRVETVMDAPDPLDEDAPPRCNRILLKSQGRAYEVGSFLPPDEKISFAKALRGALADWNRPARNPPGPQP